MLVVLFIFFVILHQRVCGRLKIVNLNSFIMAKVKFGMMMTDASGKLGGQVFSKNRSGSYVRTKVTPSNPQSVAQQAIRSILSTVSSGWSDLTQAQRNSFNNAVEDWKKTDIFGDLKKPTGKNLYSALNINLLNTNQATILIAPAKTEIPFLNVTDVLGTVSTTSLVIEPTGDATGLVVIVSATPMLSAGTGFYKGKFREIALVDGADITGYDVWDQYVARFGTPVAGANIAFSFKLVAPNGQAGVVEVVKAVISA